MRGLRNSADYLYEKDIATFNRELAQVETLFLFADSTYAHISSSAVRELLGNIMQIFRVMYLRQSVI